MAQAWMGEYLTDKDDDFNQFAVRMKNQKYPDATIASFHRCYDETVNGNVQEIGELDIRPLDVSTVSKLSDCVFVDPKGMPELMSKLAIIKLNGGVGDTMQMTTPKGLLKISEVRNRPVNILDISAKQILSARRTTNTPIPAFFMNSRNTNKGTTTYLEKYAELDCTPGLGTDLLHTFVQNSFPKVDAHTGKPALWPESQDLEWQPAGNGDIFNSLYSTGELDWMLESGFEYAYISPTTNLQADFEPRIFKKFTESNCAVMAESCLRAEQDKNSAHLATTGAGHFVNREPQQTPEHDHAAFQDVDTHKAFGTGSLWVKLKDLKILLDVHQGAIPLPTIARETRLVRSNDKSPSVIQLTTSMLSILPFFPVHDINGSLTGSAELIMVDRTSRYAPVKTTANVLVCRSDAYDIDMQTSKFVLHEPRAHLFTDGTPIVPPVVELDQEIYGSLAGFEEYFTGERYGYPSLKHCRSLALNGKIAITEGTGFEGVCHVTSTFGEHKVVAKDNYLDLRFELTYHDQ